jgi:hypothetical protein
VIVCAVLADACIGVTEFWAIFLPVFLIDSLEDCLNLFSGLLRCLGSDAAAWISF